MQGTSEIASTEGWSEGNIEAGKCGNGLKQGVGASICDS
jgi:hypothetical protein